MLPVGSVNPVSRPTLAALARTWVAAIAAELAEGQHAAIAARLDDLLQVELEIADATERLAGELT